jgi:glycosyltransferase involved in cell wall biosynthesis
VKNKTPLVSVVIATRNRPNKVINCLASLFNNDFQDFKIYLTDQSNNDLTEKMVKKFDSDRLIYFHLLTKGKSRALNFVLPKLKSEIIAFTDDDCIVAKNWLRLIWNIFNQNKEIDSLFGQVLPYQPKLNRDKFCACYFLKDTREIIDKPCVYWEEVGFGCNMAHRIKVFTKVKKFPVWLGPGSIGHSGDDGYLTLKILVNDFKILYEPKLKVSHDRWLTSEQFKKQQFNYFYSEMVCSGYFGLIGLSVGRKIIKYAIIDLVKEASRLKISGIKCLFKKTCLLIKGLTVAFWFWLKEAVFKIDSV